MTPIPCLGTIVSHNCAGGSRPRAERETYPWLAVRVRIPALQERRAGPLETPARDLRRAAGGRPAQRREDRVPKHPTPKQVGYLLGKHSPLTPEQKARLEAELESGEATVRKPTKRRHRSKGRKR